MLAQQPVSKFLDQLASNLPAPGGGSAAALSGAIGAALTSMVCGLTIGKKKYKDVEEEMKKTLAASEHLRTVLTKLIDDDTRAFDKVMEAYGLPRDTGDQVALRSAAVQEATKEAALVPLEVMKHIVDVLSLAHIVADKGNASSVSDAGVSALMLYAAAEGAALNVRINLNSIHDTEFVGWRREEVTTLLRTCKARADEVMKIVREKIPDA